MFENELTQDDRPPAAKPERNTSDVAEGVGGVDLAAKQAAGAGVARGRPSGDPPPCAAGDMGLCPTSPCASAEDASLAAEPFAAPLRKPNLTGQRRGRRLVKPAVPGSKASLSPEQRLLILDTWQRSGLPAGD